MTLRSVDGHLQDQPKPTASTPRSIVTSPPRVSLTRSVMMRLTQRFQGQIADGHRRQRPSACGREGLLGQGDDPNLKPAFALTRTMRHARPPQFDSIRSAPVRYPEFSEAELDAGLRQAWRRRDYALPADALNSSSHCSRCGGA